jgi:hypothetical protein
LVEANEKVFDLMESRRETRCGRIGAKFNFHVFIIDVRGRGVNCEL